MNYKKLSLILPFGNSQRVASSSDDDFDGDENPAETPVQREITAASTAYATDYARVGEPHPHPEHMSSAREGLTRDAHENGRMTVAELAVIANSYHERQIASESEYLELINDLHEGLLNFFANVQFANQQLCAVDKDNPAIKDHTNFMAKELLSAIREDFDQKCVRRLENYPYHEMRDIIGFLDHPYLRKEKIRVFSDGIVERCVPVFSLLRDLVNDVVTDPDLRRAFGGGKYYHEDTMYSCDEQCFVSEINLFFDTAISYFEG